MSKLLRVSNWRKVWKKQFSSCKTGNFDLPLKRNRTGGYKLVGNETVYTCFTSDFFPWRCRSVEGWSMANDPYKAWLTFFIITKRIDRFHVNLPNDWEEGYDNVSICCTVENQDRADYRLPIFLTEPIKHKSIICEPILEFIHLSDYLSSAIEMVTVGGESGDNARICNYDWILDIREQCLQKVFRFILNKRELIFKKMADFIRFPENFSIHRHKRLELIYKVAYNGNL